MTTQVSGSNLGPYHVNVGQAGVVFECDDHGPQKMKVPVKDGIPIAPPSCPECVKDELEKRRIAADDYKAKTSIENAEIPIRYREARIGDLTDPKALPLRRYADAFPEYLRDGESMILYGPTGTGKTHAAVAVMIEAILRHGKTAKIITVLDMVRRIRETWSRDSVLNEDQILQSFSKPDLLVIDDVGIQYGTENEKLILFDVINRRYNNLRPMILTSNLDLPELKEYLGDRMIDRVTQGRGGCLVVDGKSRRSGS